MNIPISILHICDLHKKIIVGDNYINMRISRKETIANIPILEIRDYFDYLDRHFIISFTLKEVCDYLKINENKADKLLKELYNNEFIKESNDGFELTVKGSALRNARCVPPINRIKAKKILNDLMQRVEEINNDNYYLYRVSKILLFGSYIKDDAVDFGDIYIAFELDKKIEDPNEFQKLNRKLVDKAEDDGKYFSSFIEKLFYSRTLVLLKLKNRNRYISLHEMDDEILEITETKQIYPVI